MLYFIPVEYEDRLKTLETHKVSKIKDKLHQKEGSKPKRWHQGIQNTEPVQKRKCFFVFCLFDDSEGKLQDNSYTAELKSNWSRLKWHDGKL